MRATLKSDSVFLRLQTGGEGLFEVIHLRGGGMSRCLRLRSRLLGCLVRLAFGPRAITDCADARTDRRTLARVAGDGTDYRPAGSPAHRTSHCGTRRGLLRLLLLLRGLLLLLRGLVGDMKGVVARLLHPPGVALRFVLRLLRSTLAGARKGVDLERGRQRFRSGRRADEWSLSLRCGQEGCRCENTDS